jgi:hypothetical protein
MPKKSKIIEVPVPEPEPIEEKKEDIKISKRTGKPTRPLTELQMETLRKGRELAVAKRKQLIEGIDLEKRALDIKKAKDEMKEKIDDSYEKLNHVVGISLVLEAALLAFMAGGFLLFFPACIVMFRRVERRLKTIMQEMSLRSDVGTVFLPYEFSPAAADGGV